MNTFGEAVREARLQAGISLNALARRAGVDPAYIHRIESTRVDRAPLPRRPVVLAIAAALELDPRATDVLLVRAGHVPQALVELGGWDHTLAALAELLLDPDVSGPAKAELREVVRILVQRWAGAQRP
jgi:transcriptional regulator with XRE-family HTH domain